MQPITPLFLVGLFVAILLGTLLAFEVGLHLGRWRSRKPNPEALLPVRMLVTSTLGMLSFILGFTFGLASSHFDTRSQSIFDEATAIGTAYHRADLLPEPERTNERRLIRHYLDVRLEPLKGAKTDVVGRLRELQEQMWHEAVGASRKDGAASFVMPFTQSLIEINAQVERVLTGVRSRIPVVVWIILNAIMAISVAAAGYHAGLAGTQRSIAAVAYALVFAAVIVLITAADIPGLSQLRTSHQALVDLQERLKTP
ncbi:MAG TPA: hypothetical protein VLG74_00955 [Blastocatellia bacterium]|nr:hypothetical protein [Blastocatellia bacterium]